MRIAHFRVLAIGLFVIAVSFATFLSTQSVHAAVGTGGSGGGGSANCDGGGIDGCPWTTNGQGWFQISVDDSNAPQGNGYWANASATCRAEGTTHVIAYLVLTGEKTLSQAWVYKFQWPWETYGEYVGNVSVSTAEAMFQQVPDKQGYTFGEDVGWFCYNDNPPWSISTSVSVDKSIAYAGDTITWTHVVTNSGPNRTNKPVTWHAQDRGDIGNGAGGNWTLGSGSGNGTSNTNTSSYVVGASDFGKNICRTTMASPKSNDDSGAIESAASCVVIAKKPKVQVHGGDVRAIGPIGKGSVTTSTGRLNGTTYGSWAEYGILASGKVTGMASGSGYAGGVGTTNLCSALSLLSFSNASNPASPTCDANKIGRYTSGDASQIDAIISRFTPTAGAPTLSGTKDIQSLTSGTVYLGSGTLTLTSRGTIPAGKWVVINAPSATVRIAQNIQYTTASLASAKDLPQVVIIAKNIIITDTVTNVDAWLIAKSTNTTDGIVNTCDAPGINEPSQLTSKVCNAPLTVNGPVLASHLLLYRTGGTGDTAASAGDPAEIFNLRPDAYVWANGISGNTSRARTVMTTELPPRF